MIRPIATQPASSSRSVRNRDGSITGVRRSRSLGDLGRIGTMADLSTSESLVSGRMYGSESTLDSVPADQPVTAAQRSSVVAVDDMSLPSASSSSDVDNRPTVVFPPLSKVTTGSPRKERVVTADDRSPKNRNHPLPRQQLLRQECPSILPVLVLRRQRLR